LWHECEPVWLTLTKTGRVSSSSSKNFKKERRAPFGRGISAPVFLDRNSIIRFRLWPQLETLRTSIRSRTEIGKGNGERTSTGTYCLEREAGSAPMQRNLTIDFPATAKLSAERNASETFECSATCSLSASAALEPQASVTERLNALPPVQSTESARDGQKLFIVC
jgi:hypothetical protein